jgi:hypothetical protein
LPVRAASLEPGRAAGGFQKAKKDVQTDGHSRNVIETDLLWRGWGLPVLFHAQSARITRKVVFNLKTNSPRAVLSGWSATDWNKSGPWRHLLKEAV